MKAGDSYALLDRVVAMIQEQHEVDARVFPGVFFNYELLLSRYLANRAEEMRGRELEFLGLE